MRAGKRWAKLELEQAKSGSIAARRLARTAVSDAAVGVAVGCLPVVRGRWMRRSHNAMRNAAWFVRNARITGVNEGEMLTRLVAEVRRLSEAGETLESIVPDLVDLFTRA